MIIEILKFYGMIGLSDQPRIQHLEDQIAQHLST